MTKVSALTMIGTAHVDGDCPSAGCISVIRSGDVIFLVTEDEDGKDEDTIIIHSAHQAQAVVDAIRGVSVSQGWDVK
jgi:hypothetical protein